MWVSNMMPDIMGGSRSIATKISEGNRTCDITRELSSKGALLL
jgi:hypothetical protein